MLTSSGGRLSPKLSRPISVAHISFVSGWKVKKTEFLNPPANSAVKDPEGSDSKIAARFHVTSSTHTSQEDPTLIYNLTSERVFFPCVPDNIGFSLKLGPNAIVLVKCLPPSGKLVIFLSVFSISSNLLVS